MSPQISSVTTPTDSVYGAYHTWQSHGQDDRKQRAQPSAPIQVGPLHHFHRYGAEVAHEQAGHKRNEQGRVRDHQRPVSITNMERLVEEVDHVDPGQK